MIGILFVLIILAILYHQGKVQDKDRLIKRLEDPMYHIRVKKNDEIAYSLSNDIIRDFKNAELEQGKYCISFNKEDKTYKGYILNGYINNSIFAEIKLSVSDHYDVIVHIALTKDDEIIKRTSCSVSNDYKEFFNLSLVKKAIDKRLLTM